jgi:hypothetical protein
MEKILGMVNHDVQDGLKNKEREKLQKQINKLRKYFNKQQSETKDTIKT